MDALKREFNEVVDKATELMGYDIRKLGWTFGYNNRKTALGICCYTSKRILLSNHFKHLPQIADTIRHEVAHAYAGSKAGHGRKWKDIYRKLGGSGERLAKVDVDDRPSHKYEVVNTLTGEVVATYHRMPKRDFSKCHLKGQPHTKGALELREAY